MKAMIATEKGQHMVQFVLLLPLLIAFMGLVVDLGHAYVRQRLAQNAADAAATAGGMVLHERGIAAAESAARYYAAAHGYNNDRIGQFVDLTWPSQCIRVEVSENLTPVFASLIWNGTFPVRATAASCYRVTGVSASVLVLNPHACSALDISGGGRIHVRQGNIHVNSDCARGIDLSGGARLITQTPASYIGGYRVTGGASITPDPVRASVIPDPLADLPVPTVCASCPSRKTEQFSKGTHTVTPFCHMGGISISGSARVAFSPGVYCIGGSGLKVSGGADVSGSHVFFYLADGSFDLSGGADIDLSPPTSGDYSGVLVFQARNNREDSNFSGGSALDGISGIIYLPAAELQASGGTAAHINLVVDELKVSGGTNLDIQGFSGANWQTVTDALTE